MKGLSPFQERGSNATNTHINASSIPLFLSYFKPHLALFIADLGCAVFMAAVELIFPLVSRWTINTVLPSGNSTLFWQVSIASVGLFVLHTMASYFVAYFGHVFGVLVERDMRRDIFFHIEKQSFSFFDSHRTGKIMSRVTYDLFEISELAHHGPEDIFISLMTIVGSIVLMMHIEIWLGLVVLACMPVMGAFIALSKKALMTSSYSVKEKTADINAALESSISGARVTKVFCNEDYEEKHFQGYNDSFVQSKKIYYRAMALFHSKIDFCTHIMPVVMLMAGGSLILKDRMTVGDLVAANLFIASFLQPIRRLTNFVEQFTTGMAGFERFREIMNTHEETVESPSAIEAPILKGDIEFKGVSFAYKKDEPVLDNINLKVKAGETVALVGSSGGGKTTMCSLLPRFYDCTGGSITLDGRDIREWTLASLRRNIGIVQQDVFLFAQSIRDNIAYGKVGASIEEIKRAAALAEIDGDIEAMVDGYDTVVGERGIRLSGGQKQRISIARVFLKNPPILILDEATSSLDSDTEQKIQGAFERLSQGRTTFVIAHRLSTIRGADIIAVIDGESIAECGTHKELMALHGKYYKLYTTQYGGEDIH